MAHNPYEKFPTQYTPSASTTLSTTSNTTVSNTSLMKVCLNRRSALSLCSKAIATTAVALGVNHMGTDLSRAQTEESIDTATAMLPRYLGSENAKVTVVEYFSFTCPACKKFHDDIVPTLKETHIADGTMRIEFRDFPLDRLAARVAILARVAPVAQYESFLSAYMQSQDQWLRASNPVEQIDIIAALGGLSQQTINQATQSEAIFNFLVEGMSEAQSRFDVSATPTFIFPKDKIVGTPNMDDFEKKLNEALES